VWFRPRSLSYQLAALARLLHTCSLVTPLTHATRAQMTPCLMERWQTRLLPMSATSFCLVWIITLHTRQPRPSCTARSSAAAWILHFALRCRPLCGRLLVSWLETWRLCSCFATTSAALAIVAMFTVAHPSMKMSPPAATHPATLMRQRMGSGTPSLLCSGHPSPATFAAAFQDPTNAKYIRWHSAPERAAYCDHISDVYDGDMWKVNRHATNACVTGLFGRGGP
jgi:hypothetical protein